MSNFDIEIPLSVGEDYECVNSEDVCYAIHSPELGYYAKYQPDHEYTYTSDVSKANEWKTLEGTQSYLINIRNVDPKATVVKIRKCIEYHIYKMVDEDKSIFFAIEIAEFNRLNKQYNKDADAMTEAKYKRHVFLRQFLMEHGLVTNPSSSVYEVTKGKK